MWNYFIIEKISAFLSNKINGFQIGELFSQNKNELVMGFYSREREQFYWILNLDPAFPHMRFMKDYSRAKKNSIDLFPDLLDVEIVKVVQHQGERSFHFQLSDTGILIFKMHGRRSNVIFKKNNSTELFKNNVVSDLDWVIPKEQRFDLLNEKISNKKHLKEQYPFFDNELLSEMERNDFYNKNLDAQIEIISELKNQLLDQNLYLYKSDNKWSLHSFKPVCEYAHFTSIEEAVNDYSRKAGKDHFFQEHKLKKIKSLEQKVNKNQASIEKMSNRLSHLENSNEWEEKANIIMANLHAFQDKIEVELFDFYNNENVIIKIKEGQSPQKYAENLYRKSKNKEIEIKNLKKTIQEKERDTFEIRKELEEITEIEDSQNLKKWLKNHDGIEQGTNKKDSPYREFEINDYKIFVGRNSKNNDELTTKFASKDDIWMHAKDVSGSHLVIKKDKNKTIPSYVLEKAASIAAWYSKGKNDTLFPVIYTERKYVRKGKGLAPGQVLVDRYEVIMVKPELPESHNSLD